MGLSKENYESWFLDYSEGMLSAEQVAELFLFLEQNPELKSEFAEFENIKITDIPTAEFSGKESLKKEIFSAEQVNHLLIAELEGDLTLQEHQQLMKVNHTYPGIDNERKLFSLTKLQPAAEIFSGKQSLKKAVIRRFVLTTWQTGIAVAAVIMLAFGTWYFSRDVQNEKPQQAEDIIVPTESIPVQPEKNINVNPSQLANSDSGTSVKKEEVNKKENNTPKNINNRKRNVAAVSNSTLASTELKHEIIQLAEPKTDFQIEMEEPFAYAERRYAPTVGTPFTANNNAEPAGIILQNVKDNVASTVNTVTGETLLSSSDVQAELPAKGRLIRLAAWAVGKISSDRVKLKTAFDPLNGNLAAYEVEVGGKSRYQKQF